MITFQLENWLDVLEEAMPLWLLHYEEVGQNKEKMPLNPDIERFSKFDSYGMLNIVTVRKDGELIGYHASVIDTLPHYKNILASHSDLYWIKKEHRNASVAIKLFREVEKTCMNRGVNILYDITKTYADKGRLFEYLGYVPVEVKYSKWISN